MSKKQFSCAIRARFPRKSSAIADVRTFIVGVRTSIVDVRPFIVDGGTFSRVAVGNAVFASRFCVPLFRKKFCSVEDKYYLCSHNYELSEMLQISASTLSELISGKREPTYQLARTISTQLNIDPAIVLGV